MLASSDYFKALYRANATDTRHVHLDELPGGYDTMETIADFCYCYPIMERLTTANIGHVLCASSYLQMVGEGNLMKICTRRLNELCAESVSNCLEILEKCIDVGPSAEAEGVTATCIDEAVNHWGKNVAGQIHVFGFETLKWMSSLRNLPISWFVRMMETMMTRGSSALQLSMTAFSGRYIDWIMQCFARQQSSVSRTSLCSNTLDDPPSRADSRSLTSAFETVVGFIVKSMSGLEVLPPRWWSRVAHFSSEQMLDTKASVVGMFASPLIYDKLTPEFVKNLEPSILAEIAAQRGLESEHGAFVCANSMLVYQYLRDRAQRGSITASQFALLLKSSSWCRSECQDSIFELLEVMLENEVSEEEVEEMIAEVDFTSLSQPVLKRAARHGKIPVKVTQEAALTVCSRLRVELQTRKTGMLVIWRS